MLALRERLLTAIEGCGNRFIETIDLRPEFREIDRQPGISRVTVQSSVNSIRAGQEFARRRPHQIQ